MHDKLSQSCSINEGKSKQSIVNEKLSQSCSTNEGESKQSIVNETLSQKHSMKEDKPECAIKNKKYAKNEVAYDVTNYFNVYNVFECQIYVLYRIDMSYERACMAIQSTISNSAYFNSKEQVDGIRYSYEQVDALSEAKAYRDYVFRNDFETMNVFEQENNSGS